MATRLGAPASLILMAIAGALAQPMRDVTVRTVWQDAQDGAMVSPNGKLIAFVDWNVSEVAVRDVVSGIQRRLPDTSSLGFPEPYFVFSPNSDSLVFPFGNNRGADPFRYELRSIELSSGAHRVLTVFPPDVALVTPLAWHPRTGILVNKVAADGRSELSVLNPDTTHMRVVSRRTADAGHAWQAVFTRDGTAAVFLARDALWWLDVAAGTTRPLGVDAQILLGWAAGERALLIHAVRGDVTGNWSVAISRGQSEGAPALIARTAPGVRWAGRSETGMHYLEPAQSPALFVASLDIAAAQLLSAPERILPMPGNIPGSPAWSRDGSRLAFTSGVANRAEHRVLVSDGLRGAAREIARLDLRVTGLDRSADGKFIIVGGRAWTRDGAWVGRINASTGAIEKLVTGAPASAVGAGANGEIVFTRAALAGTRDVHVMHVRGNGTPRVLATYTINDLPRSLSVSPDGRWVAILKAIPEASASALIVLPTGEGESRTVLQLRRPDLLELNQGSLPWTADGRVLVLMRRQGKRQLAAVSVNSGEITALPFSPQEGGRRHFALHPDGRQLVYVDGAGRDELKVMLEPRRDP